MFCIRFLIYNIPVYCNYLKILFQMLVKDLNKLENKHAPYARDYCFVVSLNLKKNQTIT